MKGCMYYSTDCGFGGRRKWKLQLSSALVQESLLTKSFTFHDFSYPWSTMVQKMLNEKFQKQFLSFKLHDVLSSVIKSHAVLLHPAWDVNHSFASIPMLYKLPAC